MRILMYQDLTLSIDLESVCSGINKLGTSLRCEPGSVPFRAPGSIIRYPETYSRLSRDLCQEAAGADLAVCCTELPYDNNFFFEYIGGICILSFSGWSLLTSLPMENGLVYFLATFLAGDIFRNNELHDRTTGCISDFLGDKTAVDIGMRSAFVCASCISAFMASSPRPPEHERFTAIQRLLNELSRASRANESVNKYWQRTQKKTGFDVFMCHNSADKEEVRRICRDLKARRLRPWLDEEQLRPGLPWQETLEEQLGNIATAAVFVGASGFGPWQNRELRGFLDEFVRRQCPVIPVLLPSITSPPQLPLFLRQMTWVDYRRDARAALDLLVWGITGERPGNVGLADSAQAGDT